MKYPRFLPWPKYLDSLRHQSQQQGFLFTFFYFPSSFSQKHKRQHLLTNSVSWSKVGNKEGFYELITCQNEVESKQLTFWYVPQHSMSVFTTWSTKRTIRRYSNSVDKSSVTKVVGLQLAICQIPNLCIKPTIKRWKIHQHQMKTSKICASVQ